MDPAKVVCILTGILWMILFVFAMIQDYRDYKNKKDAVARFNEHCKMWLQENSSSKSELSE